MSTPIRIWRVEENDEGQEAATIFEVAGPKRYLAFWDKGPPSFAPDSPAHTHHSLWHGSWHWVVSKNAVQIWGPPVDEADDEEAG